MHKCPKTFGPETIAATETEIVWMKERLKTLRAAHNEQVDGPVENVDDL
jgi:hypothetical protein